MMQWRVLPPVDGPGAFHMAADVAVLEAIRAGLSGPVLRFYRWMPPCVTLGKFQPAEGNVRLENCARLGIDVARRPTGGRAILHDREVTFSMIIAEDRSARRRHQHHGQLPRARHGAGGWPVPAGAARGTGGPQGAIARGDPPSVMAAGNPACFAAKARCDLMVNGSKIIGSAQLRKDGIILQQNSLPLSIDFPIWEEVFFRSDWEAVKNGGATDLYTAAGRELAYTEVIDAICAGFESALGIQLQTDTLTPAEERRAWELAPEYAVLRVGDKVNTTG